jgi:S-DNA-T family DNA segregation ATPase FtsK/SpoIIIE
MGRRLLEFQANQIEAVLASHRLPAQVYGGLVTPRFVKFHLSPRLGTRLSKIASLSEEIALSLGAKSCRIARNNGFLDVEIPREHPQPVLLLPLCQRLSVVPPSTAVLGLDELGTPLLVRLPSPDVAHILICGTTGSGKTELARSMIASLAIHNRLSHLQLILIDPKGRGYSPFASFPHLLFPPLRDGQEATEALHWLVCEMERRDSLALSEPRLVIFIDELADLMLTSGPSTGLRASKELEHLLTRLTQRGRQAGIHLVACTQKPTTAIIGSLIKSNFPLRIVGSVTSPEDAKVASGTAGTEAHKLLGRGDFLLISRSHSLRFQGAFISPEQIAQVAHKLKGGERKSLRWEERSRHQIMSPPLKERLIRKLQILR